MSVIRTVAVRYRNNRNFSQLALAPHRRVGRKTAGIDTERRDYVTITLCIIGRTRVRRAKWLVWRWCYTLTSLISAAAAAAAVAIRSS